MPWKLPKAGSSKIAKSKTEGELQGTRVSALSRTCETLRTLQYRAVEATKNDVCARRSDNDAHRVDRVNTVNTGRGVSVFLILSKRFQFNDGCAHSREHLMATPKGPRDTVRRVGSLALPETNGKSWPNDAGGDVDDDRGNDFHVLS